MHDLRDDEVVFELLNENAGSESAECFDGGDGKTHENGWNRGDGWTKVASKQIARLPQPVNFTLFKETVSFEGIEGSGEWRVVIDSEDEVFELCEANNGAEVGR